MANSALSLLWKGSRPRQVHTLPTSGLTRQLLVQIHFEARHSPFAEVSLPIRDALRTASAAQVATYFIWMYRYASVWAIRGRRNTPAPRSFSTPTPPQSFYFPVAILVEPARRAHGRGDEDVPWVMWPVKLFDKDFARYSGGTCDILDGRIRLDDVLLWALHHRVVTIKVASAIASQAAKLGFPQMLGAQMTNPHPVSMSRRVTDGDLPLRLTGQCGPPLRSEDRELLVFLLDNGYILNSLHSWILYWAVEHGDVQVTALLVSLGAPFTKDDVLRAIKRRHATVAKILVQHPCQPLREHQALGPGAVQLCDDLLSASRECDTLWSYFASVRHSESLSGRYDLRASFDSEGNELHKDPGPILIQFRR
ncbi:hypothetical protein Q8F55_007636 [Vanrija albida]|uniref:Uncharacterized protein n=1 Tax=Vanrija albida TaxID=181172 RepID=A0ABR3PU29_9TREE